MFQLTLALLVVCYSLNAEQTLSGKHLTYEDDVIILDTNMTYRSDDATISADRAIAYRAPPGSELKISHIEFEKNLVLTIDPHGEIRSDRGTFDCLTGKGHFFGGKKPVEIRHLVIDNEGREHSGSLFTPQLSVSFRAENKTYRIESLQSTQSTKIIYDNKITFEGGRLIYHNNPSYEENRPMTGIFYLFPSPKTGMCHTDFHRGEVLSEKISLDCEKQIAHYVSPKGKLPFSTKEHIERQLKFSGNHLYLRRDNNHALLEGNAKIKDPIMGTIEGKREIHFYFSPDIEKNVERIRAEGPATFVSLLGEKLYCSGMVTIDREEGTITASSPREDPLVFLGNSYRLSCLEFIGTFSEDNEVLTPLSCEMIGEVSLIDENPNRFLRCALADHVIYDPGNDLMILKSSPEKRVLFWDKEENIQISAHELHITDFSDKKQEKIEGKGSVHFLLSSEEKDLFRKKFPHYSPTS